MKKPCIFAVKFRDMRLFLIISIILISLTSNGQNCKKLILEPLIKSTDFDYLNLSEQSKQQLLSNIIRPYLSFKEYVLYINIDKKNISAKIKIKDSETINKIDITKNSNSYFYLYSDKKMMFSIDLKTNTALLGGFCVYKITQSLCEN